jgi:hypothetical protein
MLKVNDCWRQRLLKDGQQTRTVGSSTVFRGDAIIRMNTALILPAHQRHEHTGVGWHPRFVPHVSWCGKVYGTDISRSH